MCAGEEKITATSQLSNAEGANGDCANNDKQKFVAFARVFSGCLRRGQKLYVLGPRHDPSLLSSSQLVRLVCISYMQY